MLLSSVEVLFFYEFLYFYYGKNHKTVADLSRKHENNLSGVQKSGEEEFINVA